MSRSSKAPRGVQRVPLENVKRLPVGMQVARLFGVVEKGSHLNKISGKYQNKITLFWEFPYLWQMRFDTDEQPTPQCINGTFTYSFHEQANLRAFLVGMLGKDLSQDEWDDFNMFGIADKYYIVNVVEVAKKDDPKVIYQNVKSAMPYDPRFNIEGVDIIKHNPTMLYSISDGFESDYFVKIYSWLRRDIQASKEGLEHLQAGGVFAEPVRKDSNATNVAPPPVNQPKMSQNTQASVAMAQQPGLAAQPQPGSPVAPASAAPVDSKPKLEMIATDFSLEQYLAVPGWSEQKLVDAGKARWAQVAPTSPVATNGGQQASQPLSHVANQPATTAPTMNMGVDESGHDDLPF